MEQADRREMSLQPSPQRSPSATGNQISCLQPSLGADTAGPGALDAASLPPDPCPIHILFSPLSDWSQQQPLQGTSPPMLGFPPTPSTPLPISQPFTLAVRWPHTVSLKSPVAWTQNSIRWRWPVWSLPFFPPLLIPFSILSCHITYCSMPNKLSVMLQHQTFIILSTMWVMSELTSNFCRYNSRILILHEKNSWLTSDDPDKFNLFNASSF